MKIYFHQSGINFKRRLKSSEEAEYSSVLNEAKSKLAGGNGKNILIVPATAMPQSGLNNTGVGNIGSDESLKFFDFAKKYWGVNAVEILPIGQYHSHNGQYACYSGTTMDLGNHVINIKEFLPKDEFEKIVKANKISDRVNYRNVVDMSSAQENALRKLYGNIPQNLAKEFAIYKNSNYERLCPQGLYRALQEIHKNHNYKDWGNVDSVLYDKRFVTKEQRENRIAEILKTKFETVDFYMFKQFLAEKSLNNAKQKMNQKGLKLIGDMPCGFAYEEIWANPEAFIKDTTIGWGLPALDLDKKEAENLLRKKVNFYANLYDGIRVDASWTYVSPNHKNYITGAFNKKDWEDKFLNIIDDEVKAVKGEGFDLKDIIHEFAADYKDFSIYQAEDLKPFIKDRVQVYTSEFMSGDWGSTDSFTKKGWDSSNYIIGLSNHDTVNIKPSESQINALSKILKISKEKLADSREFLKAKFAEPMSAKNTMFFFMHALGMKGQFKGNANPFENYTAKIPENYEDLYHKSIQSGNGFNPMDALEKQFMAKGLDKTNPELFEKIKKYRKILEKKETLKGRYITVLLSASFVALASLGTMYFNKDQRYNFYKFPYV